MRSISRRTFSRWAGLTTFGSALKATDASGSALQASDPASASTGFGSRGAAQAGVVPSTTQFLHIAGYETPDDGGGAVYKRVTNQPAHDGKLQTSDGSWWELAEDMVTPSMFGDKLASLISMTPTAFLPAGTLQVHETIKYPTLTPYGGGALRGQGMETSSAFSTRASKSKSAIVWAGEDSGTLMELDGQLGLLFEQISFVGTTSPEKSRLSSVGHHWRQTGNFGSGESLYIQCSFQYFDTAIKFADSRSENTCAGVHFIKCIVQNVNNFLIIYNNQGINYVLDHISCNFIDRVAYFTRGGNLDLRNGNLAGCGRKNWCFEFSAISGNLYTNSFRNLRIEQGTQHLLKMIGSGTVIIDGLTEAQTNQRTTMFDQTGGVLVVRNSRLVTNDAANPTFIISSQAGGSPGILFLENIHFAERTFHISDWILRRAEGANTIVVVRGCTYGAKFQAIPDFSTHLSFGVPRTSATSKESVEVLLTIEGLPRSINSVVQLPPDTISTLNILVEGIDSNHDVVFSGTRRALCVNDGYVCSLKNSQAIGVDYNPFDVPQFTVEVSQDLNAVEVKATGLVGRSIRWTATFEGRPTPL